ncbi:hypothetical protein [Amphibacillus cookii]|uniref:hypothetical protein n=1 Tax=Amphibacillus cookii TaxID=767787 RepID=UPI00195F241F|nr:hypothetical protein [Amphibacillus cookii]MBM7541274.1 hypothetical protein [Amphibacillus cookii]
MVLRKMLVSLCLLLMLVACEESTHMDGSSANWQATYHRNDQLVIKYIGNESAPSQITYEISHNSKTLDGTRRCYDDLLSLTFEQDSIDMDKDFMVTIEWEEEVETFNINWIVFGVTSYLYMESVEYSYVYINMFLSVFWIVGFCTELSSETTNWGIVYY